MNNKAIVYVDLGGSGISAIAGEVLENHALRILGEQVRPGDDVKSGVVERMTGAAFKVNESTKLLQNVLKWKESILSVSTSVNAKSMKHHPYTVERRIQQVVTEAMLREMRAECRSGIKTADVVVYEVIPLAYYVDDARVENPLGARGDVLRIDFNLIIGHHLVKESLERTIERTGIAVDHIHLGMEALATAVLEEKDRQEGCALINMGATTTTLAVYAEGKWQELLVVPLGGLNITKDILELGVSFKNAETLKCRKGCAMEKYVTEPVNIQIPALSPDAEPVRISTAFLAVIIESRLDEIFSSIFSQINTIPYPLHAGIVIAGGAAQLAYLPEYITEKTGLQVRVGNHAEWLSDDTDAQFASPQYAQAVGALLLSNDLYERNKEVADKKAAIGIKIPGKRMLSNLTKSFTVSMESIFGYEEIERMRLEAQEIKNEKPSE